MNRLQLATLVSWADNQEIEGRKRLQKVAFLLQAAGCPLDCQFILHHYGPYSRDVAGACDEMVAAGLVEEKTTVQGGITQYSYTLTPRTRESLAQIAPPPMTEHEALGRALLRENLWTLELGSTILYFQSKPMDWNSALQEACTFKEVASSDAASQAALALARKVGGLRTPGQAAP